jgi:hypothetical protein
MAWLVIVALIVGIFPTASTWLGTRAVPVTAVAIAATTAATRLRVFIR